MNRKEELRYLTLLCLEASRWERSEGEVKSGLELEVEHRLNSLLDVDDKVDDRIVIQSPAEVNPVIHLDATEAVSGSPGKEDYVRITVNGRRRSFLKMFCKKVPCKHSKTGYRWLPPEGTV